MQREYQGFIFTNHALDRMKLRGLSQDKVVTVLRQPQITEPSGKAQTTKFIRQIDDREIQVIATLIENKRWLVVSVWVKGEKDPQPLIWQIMTAPFALVWYVVKKYLLHIK